MSLYRNPEDHAENAPDTWTVVKRAERHFNVVDRNGTELAATTTKRQATALLTSGHLVDAYALESRWYAGEPVANWKTWAECLAEQERHAAWLASKTTA